MDLVDISLTQCYKTIVYAIIKYNIILLFYFMLFYDVRHSMAFSNMLKYAKMIFHILC